MQAFYKALYGVSVDGSGSTSNKFCLDDDDDENDDDDDDDGHISEPFANFLQERGSESGSDSEGHCNDSPASTNNLILNNDERGNKSGRNDALEENTNSDFVKDESNLDTLWNMNDSGNSRRYLTVIDEAPYCGPNAFVPNSAEHFNRQQLLHQRQHCRFPEAPFGRCDSDGEEYPADPGPSTSSESLESVISRESVVSAASISAELRVRRNFDY